MSLQPFLMCSSSVIYGQRVELIAMLDTTVVQEFQRIVGTTHALQEEALTAGYTLSLIHI